MRQQERALKNLCERLTLATVGGKISWQASEKTVFQYSTGVSSVAISSVDGDGYEPFLMEVFDERGVMVEQLKTAFYTGEFGTQEVEDWNESLSNLYGAARSNALNIDTVISSLLDSLE